MSFPPPGEQPPSPQPGGPTGGRSRGIIAAVLIGALVAVGGGATTAGLLLGGGDDNVASSDSPLETAEAFVQAARDADCDAIESLMTDRYLQLVDGSCQVDALAGFDPSDPELTEASDDAAVATFEESEVVVTLRLVRTGGLWLIDEITAGSALASGGS